MSKVRCLFFLFCLLFILACKNGSNNTVRVLMDDVADSMLVFSFEDEAFFDTLSEENIIESIKYIPLSSEREAIMPEGLIIRKFSKEFLAIEFSGSPKQPKIFDLNGNYIKDAFHIGRGPNELSNLMTFTANEKSNKAYFLSFDKILSLNMNDYSMFTRTIPNSLENHVSFDWCALNNGDLVTKTSFPVEDFETNKYPFLFVYDSCFNKVKEHYYSHSRDLYQNLISGVTPPPCEAWSISSSPNGGTFIDMYSDTIYSILDGGELKPAYIISRGDKYMPTIEEVNYPADKKFKKIYYRYIVENDQYVILHYAYDNKYFVNIWNKQNGKLLCHQEVSSMLFYPIDFSIGGYHGELYVDYITSDNCIYVAIPARDLMEEIPGLKPDDNPVIVEIKLKDNYNPIKQ
jgi:hypothetical protein